MYKQTVLGPAWILINPLMSTAMYCVMFGTIAQLSPAGVRTFSGMNLPVSRLLYPQLQKDYMSLLFAERETP